MTGLAFDHLIISDFKSYTGKHEIALDRAPGLYFVTGRNHARPEMGANGVGKSTIWDAVYWCLYGRTLRHARPGAAIEPWSGKGNTFVRLQFKRGGRSYDVERGRRPNTLILDARDCEQQDIEQAIGLSEEAFRRTIVLPQIGSLFLDLRAEAQSSLFVETLNLDLWLRASESAGKELRKHEDDIAECTRYRDLQVGGLSRLMTQLEQARRAQEAFEDDVSADIRATKKKLQEAKDELSALPKPRARRDVSSTTDGIRTKINEGNEARAVLKIEIRDCLAWIQSLQMSIEQMRKTPDKCVVCEQKVTRAHVAKKIKEFEEEADKAGDKLDDHKRTLGESERAHARLCDELMEAERADRKERDAQAEADRKRATLTERVASLQKELDRLKDAPNPHAQTIKNVKQGVKDTEAELTKAEDALKKAEARASAYRYWQGAFKEIRLSLIDEALEELEIATNRHVEALGMYGWEIRFATERENKAGNTTYGFTVSLYPPGKDVAIPWETYSGGEVQRWHLATTFGLSEVLLARAGLSPSIEIYDEPTQHLSKEGVDDLLVTLRDRAQELKRSIYFVDHRAIDRGEFDGMIMVEMDERGSSIRRG